MPAQALLSIKFQAGSHAALAFVAIFTLPTAVVRLDHASYTSTFALWLGQKYLPYAAMVGRGKREWMALLVKKRYASSRVHKSILSSILSADFA